MKRTIITVVLTLVAVVVIVLTFIYSGIYNVSQLSPHNSVVRWMINTAKDRSIHSRIEDIKVPPLNDNTMIVAGFKHYNEMCVTCHGAPGEEMDELTKGLTPEPPKLFEHAKDLEPNEVYWVVKNGIKYTAMPAFAPTHSVAKSEAMFNPADGASVFFDFLWRGPTWMFINWFLYKALLAKGCAGEADKMFTSASRLIETSGFREYYHPFTGEGYGAKNFTWSGLILDMMRQKR